ncbi:MAG: Fur family iron response transcriptional regulator [Gammaproteobacteria bacterium]|jgi:Fur family iron response transcriptional regulator
MNFGEQHIIDSEHIKQTLEDHTIRPTSQRIDVAKVLLAKPQHLSAEQVLAQVNTKNHLVSKATVYNTLNLFADKGLIKQVVIDSRYVFYDSNTEPHHHFYNEDTGLLYDIDDGAMLVNEVPNLPKNTVQSGIDVVIRVKNQV